MKHFALLVATLALGNLQACAQSGGMQDAGALILQADADNDGIVTRNEFLTRRSAAFSDLDGDASGSLTISEVEGFISGRTQRFTGKAFDMVDANGDGLVSRDEWENNPPRAFDRLDRDGDGNLSQQELDRLL